MIPIEQDYLQIIIIFFFFFNWGWFDTILIEVRQISKYLRKIENEPDRQVYNFLFVVIPFRLFTLLTQSVQYKVLEKVTVYKSYDSEVNRVNRLQKKNQNKSMRNILRVNRATKPELLLLMSDFLSVNQKVTMNTLIFIFKILTL